MERRSFLKWLGIGAVAAPVALAAAKEAPEVPFRKKLDFSKEAFSVDVKDIPVCTNATQAMTIQMDETWKLLPNGKYQQQWSANGRNFFSAEYDELPFVKISYNPIFRARLHGVSVKD